MACIVCRVSGHSIVEFYNSTPTKVYDTMEISREGLPFSFPALPASKKIWDDVLKTAQLFKYGSISLGIVFDICAWKLLAGRPFLKALALLVITAAAGIFNHGASVLVTRASQRNLRMDNAAQMIAAFRKTVIQNGLSCFGRELKQQNYPFRSRATELFTAREVEELYDRWAEDQQDKRNIPWAFGQVFVGLGEKFLDAMQKTRPIQTAIEECCIFNRVILESDSKDLFSHRQEAIKGQFMRLFETQLSQTSPFYNTFMSRYIEAASNACLTEEMKCFGLGFLFKKYLPMVFTDVLKVTAEMKQVIQVGSPVMNEFFNGATTLIFDQIFKEVFRSDGLDNHAAYMAWIKEQFEKLPDQEFTKSFLIDVLTFSLKGSGNL